MAYQMKRIKSRYPTEKLNKQWIEYFLHFEFKASNNEVMYKALVAGLELAKKFKAEVTSVFSDFVLIVNQVNGNL